MPTRVCFFTVAFRVVGLLSPGNFCHKTRLQFGDPVQVALLITRKPQGNHLVVVFLFFRVSFSGGGMVSTCSCHIPKWL